MDGSHLSTAQVAERLGLSPHRVRNLAHAGELAHVVERGNLRFPPDAVEHYRQTQTAEPAPPSAPIELLLVETVVGRSIAELPALLTADEAAELLGTTSRRVREAVEVGDLPGVRIGRRWRIPAPALISLLISGAGPDAPMAESA